MQYANRYLKILAEFTKCKKSFLFGFFILFSPIVFCVNISNRKRIMKTNAKVFFLILTTALLVFSACKSDDPTGPDNNNHQTDPDPPDYSSFNRAFFRLNVMITKQYAAYSSDTWWIFGTTYNMPVSYSNGVFSGDTVYYWFDGEQVEELTITMDTLTGILSQLEFQLVFNGPISDYTQSISLSNVNRTYQDFNCIVYSDSGTAACSHVNSLDYDYNNSSEPSSEFVVTTHECYESSVLEVSFGR